MGFLRKWLTGLMHKSPIQQQIQQQPQPNLISGNLSQNVLIIRDIFRDTPDLIVRHLIIKQTGQRAALVYLEGLTDKNSITNNVLDPLQLQTGSSTSDLPVTVGSVTEITGINDIEHAILHGLSVLIINESTVAYSYDTQGWPQRAIEDPQIESSLKGGHQGFVETASQNIALIRRYIPDRELKMKSIIVGRRGKTSVTIMYLEDVAHPEVLQELYDRIKLLDVDAILNSGELEGFIEDNPFSPFPQFISTERPDAVASQILQGRLAIVVDRSPAVLVGPASFTSFFQSVDDYSTRWLVASFNRLMRFMAFLLAICLPSLYIAAISFNYEVIPVKLILSIGESRERVPFPPFVEALLMEITLEMLREAGVRLPSPIGQTVGIVGGIVIGQAAVQAGIVSNIMVIVVASTAIASFIIPNYDMASAIRLLRFPMMLMAWMFGIVGIVIGLMTLIGHLIALESLGTPYGSPFAPVRFSDLKDTIFRFPIWKMTKRPVSARATQMRRQGSNRPRGDGK